MRTEELFGACALLIILVLCYFDRSMVPLCYFCTGIAFSSELGRMATLAEQLMLRKAKLTKVQSSEALELQPEVFDESHGEWRLCTTAEDSYACPAELRCLSFDLMKECNLLSARMDALIKLIHRVHPDFVCLQENTGHHDTLLVAAPTLRSSFYRSPFSGQGHGFKVTLYSKLPFSAGLMLYDLKGRPCVTGYVKMHGPDGELKMLAVSCVHLTSGTNSGIRREQLMTIYERTASCETSLVVGDFNAAQPSEDDASVEQKGFLDVWPSLHPKDAGLTRCCGGHGARLDRVALRSGSWSAQSMYIVGQEPVAVTDGGEAVTISDHFGLVAVLRPKRIVSTRRRAGQK